MIFIREGLLAKRLYAYEDNTSETICLEVTISKKKWCITFTYRPPYNSNKDGFFQELHTFLNNITKKKKRKCPSYLGDCRKLILSLFRAFFKRIPGKTTAFLHELDQELNNGVICNSQDKQYDLFSHIFRTILDHHAPLNTKTRRGNQAKIMTKELSKSNKNRSRFKKCI